MNKMPNVQLPVCPKFVKQHEFDVLYAAFDNKKLKFGLQNHMKFK